MHVRVGCDIARIVQRIHHANGLAAFDGGPGDALSQGDIVKTHALVVAHAEAVPQNLSFRIDQEDTEGVVIDQLADGCRDLSEQLIHIENGAELL
jgi:hypothetical protein